jgi:hypothetical protein
MKTESENHTPDSMPELEKCGSSIFEIGTGDIVAECRGGKQQRYERARYIVRACNSHGALVEALEVFTSTCDSAPPIEFIQRIGEACKIAKAALAKAKGRV